MIKRKNAVVAAALIIVFCLFLAACLFGAKPETKRVAYTEFLELLNASKVSSVTLTEGATMLFYLDDDGVRYITDNPRSENLKELLLLKGAAVSEGGPLAGSGAVQAAVSVLVFAGAFLIMYRMSGRAGARSVMALNAADAAAGPDRLSFEDVAGNEEAKQSVADIIDFMKQPEKYEKYGARVPRGVIFHGPPGTGKTLLARAVAGEAGVPFYAVGGSDFVQMYVGVGAGRIRDLFKKARQNGKAVIFIDEIDALGKKRSAAASGGNDERDQTLNALLTEMSGFTSKDGVVVIAATNRVDMLDEALLRPGRFDRCVEVGLPDVCARRSILACHARNKPLAEDVCLDNLARETVYFSGAMLENFLNEAAIISAKLGKAAIENDDLEKAYYIILAGSEKKQRGLERDRQVTAFHEAGHALASAFATPENRIAKRTIIPSTKGAGGFCVNIPQEKMFYSKKEIRARIVVLLAGRAAEELVFGSENITTGASNDLEKASAIAADYVCKYGMGEYSGLLSGAAFGGTFGERKEALDECARLLADLYEQAKAILENDLHSLNRLAAALLERESMSGAEISDVIAGSAALCHPVV